MKRVFLLLTTMVAMSVNAQIEVNSFTPGANEGVTYCLPDTRIEVTLNATCIKRTPGEFSRYAERYLRTKNAIEEAGITWKLSACAFRVGKCVIIGKFGSGTDQIIIDLDQNLIRFQFTVFKIFFEGSPFFFRKINDRNFLHYLLMFVKSPVKILQKTQNCNLFFYHFPKTFPEHLI